MTLVEILGKTHHTLYRQLRLLENKCCLRSIYWSLISILQSHVNMESCSVGKLLQKEADCHKKTYTRKEDLHLLWDLNPASRKLLERRLGSAPETLGQQSTVCLHHEKELLEKYEFLQKKCCDPFEDHPGAVRKGSLRTLDLDAAEKLEKLVSRNIKPGQKLCPKCYQHFKEQIDQSTDSDDDSAYLPDDDKIASLNDSLTSIGVSPVKKKRLSGAAKISYGKKKVHQVQTAIVQNVAEVLDAGAASVAPDIPKSVCRNCSDLEDLMASLKEKCKISSRAQQVQIMTLVPNSWSMTKTTEYFGVTEYIVRKSRQLRKTDGILAICAPRRGKEMSTEVKKTVWDFYEDDENSRMCPGKKDCVSVMIDGTKQKIQKRLLLMNVSELYQCFKEKHSEMKIGLSKFCELRPRWCITVGARGTHSVCVCELHQNPKLMLSAVLPGVDYKEVMAKLVCDIQSRDCMIHRCEQCPGKDSLAEHLLNLLNDKEMSEDDEVTFKQWLHTDRTDLVTRTESVSDYVEALANMMDNLTTHHYIAKAQAQYLRECKEQLSEDTALVLLDFAENYSFLVQDAVQGVHWNNTQATLHPFVVYHKKGGKTTPINYCVISDHMKHDTITVHAFLTKVLHHLKQQLPHLCKVKYFSDGAASQYKNFKNFCNLMHHKEDFGLHAEWHFFATSHGKSPCDGVGGTAKRLAARASLQATTTSHILTPHQMFEWERDHVPGIHFFYVTSEDILQITPAQEERFKMAKKIPGTRNHHCFVPQENADMVISRISSDLAQMVATRVPTTPETDHVRYQAGQYVSAVYDRSWYVGIIMDISEENSDILINFMSHDDRVPPSFKWPRRRDECWVPNSHMLCQVDAPHTATSGRVYRLCDDQVTEIQQRFQKFADDHF